jgi:ribosomal protein L11 methylase PrmA
MGEHILEASFRDPSGFIFLKDGQLYRQINNGYKNEYELLMQSGLYRQLTEQGLLVEHEEVAVTGMSEECYKVVRPQLIPYISYPYEWTFSQLQDAAVLTLKIQEKALSHGMSLKDASAFNVQFVGNKPIFIDSLSFEKLDATRPWVAYRQFCQHFLAPLALMSICDVRTRHLLKSFIDGIPLDLASSLLPTRTYLSYSLLAHIHLHARSQQKHQDDAVDESTAAAPKMSERMLNALTISLQNSVKKLELRDFSTEWGEYYQATNYSVKAMAHKESLISDWIDENWSDHIIHDMGANTGRFSHIAASKGATVVSHDIDEQAIERHYRQVRESGPANVLPLHFDLTNPTPAIGWRNRERDSLIDRVNGEFVLALALIHHLAISNNVPLALIAKFFAEVAEFLIIEFVPKSDSQVRRLLATRPDIFPDYTEAGFETAFSDLFSIVTKTQVEESDRTLYLLKRVGS